MITYRHTQPGWLIRVTMGGCAIVAAAVALSMRFSGTIALAATAASIIMVLACLLYHSLTVELTAKQLSLRFGLGLIRCTFPTQQLSNAQVVRSRWYHGWGTKYTPHGWLFSVSGLDAVEIALQNGRTYRIGTDEPHKLCAAIRDRIQAQKNSAYQS